jgi:hypothetical protein
VVEFVEELVKYLTVGGTVLTVAVLVRLVTSGLWRKYPWFAGYLLTLSIESGLLTAIHDRKVGVQQAVWFGTRLVTVFLELKAVLEIFAQWTVSFPGIGAFGRKLFAFVIVIAIVVAAVTLPVGLPKGTWDGVLKAALVMNRGAVIGFAMFLILTVGFFQKFGGPVSPNLRRHTWAMAAYVSATAVSYFVLLAVTAWSKGLVGNVLMPSVTLAALIYWLVALTPSGETQPETPRNDDNWEDAEEMNRQMQKLADAITLSPRGVKK